VASAWLMHHPAAILVSSFRHFGVAFALATESVTSIAFHLHTINAQTFHQSERCTNSGSFLVALVKRLHEVFGNYSTRHMSRPWWVCFVSCKLRGQGSHCLFEQARHAIFREKSLTTVPNNSTDVAAWRQFHGSCYLNTTLRLQSAQSSSIL
jgi:hypothetical protein